VRTREHGVAASRYQVQEEPNAVHSDGEHQPVLESMRNAASKHARTRSLLDC